LLSLLAQAAPTPLVPFANRIAGSRFSFAGREYRLRPQDRAGEGGSVTRVPAPEIEALVVQVLRSSHDTAECATAAGGPNGTGAAETDAALVERRLEGVVVRHPLLR